jgi:NAD(P)H-dependent flavin oxidoreductase YrpB (nitropropane dioxygenase family)
MNTLTTPLCATLGIDVPIAQAPIGSATTPALAAAVCGAGGLGTLALTWVSAQEAQQRIRQTRQLTDRPFAVNLVLDFPVDEVLAACLDEHVPVISTFWGDPSEISPQIHEAGALHLHTVGSVRDARQAVSAGADVIVAQGWEAGGHVRGETATMALVPAVVDAVGSVPVIAAGGIGDGRGLAAVLALGAQAGWIGTRFLTALEANTHGDYRRRLADASATDTVLTGCFDGGWPHAPHRVLRNSTVRAWEAAGRPASPDRPGENEVVATHRHAGPRHRYHMSIPTTGTSGDVEAMALYAGQSVALAEMPAPAASIVAAIARQAADVLGRAAGTTAGQR